MTANLRVVQFPGATCADIPSQLRDLAESIEAGRFGAGHNVAWVVDCGDGVVEVGLAGKAASPGAEAYLLLAQGQRRLERLT